MKDPALGELAGRSLTESKKCVLEEATGQEWLVEISTRLLSKEGPLCQSVAERISTSHMRLGSRGEVVWVEGSSFTLDPCFPEQPLEAGSRWEALELRFFVEKFEEPNAQNPRLIAHYVGHSRQQQVASDGQPFTTEVKATTASSVGEGRLLRSQGVQTTQWADGRIFESVSKVHLVSVT
jgi:hypothetical protein